MNNNRSEKGQVLVLILLGIVGLFAFTALAVDMGQIFLARRSAQAAADSAALAAAMDFATGSKVKATALAKGVAIAGTNGYNNDGVTNWVEVMNPPDSGPYSAALSPDSGQYYMARIRVKMDPIFAQLFFNGSEETTVEAVARAKPSEAVTGKDALLALSDDDDAFLLKGGAKIEVKNGHVRSNGGFTLSGGGNGYMDVYSPGDIFYKTGFSYDDKHDDYFRIAKPGPGTQAAMPNVPEPYCPTKNETHDGVNYYYYPSGIGGTKHFEPGIHCIEGGIDKGDYTGTGVLLVVLSGEIKQTGNDHFNIKAASNLIDKNGNQFGGMVMYSPPSNKDLLKFVGNSGDYFQGVLFLPGALCELGGTHDGGAIRAAFVCNKFVFHGGPVFNIDYQPSNLNQTRPSVELVQ